LENAEEFRRGLDEDKFDESFHMTDIAEEDEDITGTTQYGKGFDESYFNNKLGKTYRS
jgi:hypothetical protein